jgi:hypothetical protein
MEDENLRSFDLIPQNYLAEIYGVMELGSRNEGMEVYKEP